MTGPVGAAVGAAVGAVAGALAGRAVRADPVAEDAYWRDNYAGRDYVDPGTSYDDIRRPIATVEVRFLYRTPPLRMPQCLDSWYLTARLFPALLGESGNSVWVTYGRTSDVG